ncbi:hypothetical protein [Streptomyces sp. NPDC059909]|uniref:hypothetical protein n=1 Tax=Streptomyces sp. NPDC059909 TaxID=3346998 RepID=UPI00366296B7
MAVEEAQGFLGGVDMQQGVRLQSVDQADQDHGLVVGLTAAWTFTSSPFARRAGLPSRLPLRREFGDKLAKVFP